MCGRDCPKTTATGGGSAAGASPRGVGLLPAAQGPPQPQREHAEERRAPSELRAVLAIEGRGVAGGLSAGRVLLRPPAPQPRSQVQRIVRPSALKR